MKPIKRPGARLIGLIAALALTSCSASEGLGRPPPAPSSTSSTQIASTVSTTSLATSTPAVPADTIAVAEAATDALAATTFEWSAIELDDSLRQRMQPSWRPGCPVPLEDLRYISLTHWGFDGQVKRGEMLVNADAVEALRRAFASLFEQGFPIRQMRLVDDFGADDHRSMNADNTSAFNCRVVAGSDHWSQHAYGRAIDINPVENPYVAGTSISPPGGAEFRDRNLIRSGMLVAGPAVDAFNAVGWGWGGNWKSSKDYQHVSRTGS